MQSQREIILIAHDIRSCHNVGSLLRTAEGLGVKEVYMTGYTPHPMAPGDTRLPHEAQKLHKQISKTALGAEELVNWCHEKDVMAVIERLRDQGFSVMAVEQSAQSIKLPEYTPPQKLVLVLGREVEGIEQAVIDACDGTLEIPMFGQKESFNVVQAAAMTLYHCVFAS